MTDAALVVALAGAGAFAASGALIAVSAGARAQPATYFTVFFAPSLLLLAWGWANGEAAPFNAAATGLGVLIALGNLALARTYAVGPTMATALALSLSGILAMAFAAIALNAPITPLGLLGAGALASAVFIATQAPAQSPRAAKLWAGLVLLTCALLAGRAMVVSWRLSEGESATALVAAAYGTAFAVTASLAIGARFWAPRRAPKSKPDWARAALAGGLSAMGLLLFGHSLSAGDATVSNAVFGAYPALTVFILAAATGAWRQPRLAWSVALSLIGLALLALRGLAV